MAVFVVAALEPGRTLWTAALDAVRLGRDDDVAEVTAGQVRAVVQRLVSGIPAIRMCWLCRLPVTTWPSWRF
jgi:hypothetical protein